MTVLILIASSFIATNVDNIVLLVGWVTSRQISFFRMALGYTAAVTAVFLVSLFFEQLSSVIPVRYIGYLGLVPVLLGLRMLLGRRKQSETATTGGEPSQLSIAAVATTLFSSSLDTILVFSSLLADSRYAADAMIILGYGLTAFIWLLFAGFLSRHAVRLRALSVAAQWLTPVVMIIVGSYILLNTATDVLPG
jgi:cadmium resistance protein CadD (predicted permease)